MPAGTRARRTRIAIACQGGGSQTAFTAGVLSELLRRDVHREFEIVSLTGTSGGAICAALVWFALRRGEVEPWRRLEAFWADNTAQTPLERAFNDNLVDTLRRVSRGHLPVFQTSPSMPMMQLVTQALTAGLRPGFVDLNLLLETHIDFAEVARWGASPALPNLLLGAVNIQSGQLRVFSSRNEAITAAHVRASCAVPNIFEAVEVDGEPYWDGLFSDNPPIAEVIRPGFVGAENFPDEIWVIKINPTRCEEVPTSPEAVADRRNELIGNVSLFQQLSSLAWLNDILSRDGFRPEFLAGLGVTKPLRMPPGAPDEPPRPWHIPMIQMSAELQATLDYESKLDRNPGNIRALMEDGALQAVEFLAAREP
jgi:NTE family protein